MHTSEATQRRPSRRAVALLPLAGLPGLVVLGLAASFTVCGVSGCSGGGFGRVTDPTLTVTLVALAGAALCLPLLAYAAWLRHARLAASAVALGLAGSLLVGSAIGADWRGCPRNVSAQTCLEERGH
jgi:hypothetical protein